MKSMIYKNGYYKMDDIPYEWLTNKIILIQRDVMIIIRFL